MWIELLQWSRIDTDNENNNHSNPFNIIIDYCQHCIMHSSKNILQHDLTYWLVFFQCTCTHFKDLFDIRYTWFRHQKSRCVTEKPGFAFTVDGNVWMRLLPVEGNNLITPSSDSTSLEAFLLSSCCRLNLVLSVFSCRRIHWLPWSRPDLLCWWFVDQVTTEAMAWSVPDILNSLWVSFTCVAVRYCTL